MPTDRDWKRLAASQDKRIAELEAAIRKHRNWIWGSDPKQVASTHDRELYAVLSKPEQK